MRALLRGLLLGIAIVAASAAGAAAQADRSLSALEVAIACAPPPSVAMPSGRVLHVIGAQDTVSRSLFTNADLIVVDGGTQAGVQLGQQFYVRRPLMFGTSRVKPQGLLTLGWIRIVAANETTAIASVEHLCEGIGAGDYLEPYAPPTLPAGADRDDPAGEPDFTSLGRVLQGAENHSAGGRGDLMLIDQGEERGAKPGARVAIYRDLRAPGMPLSSVGEAVIVSTGKEMSLVLVTRSRDAIVAGDYVVPRK